MVPCGYGRLTRTLVYPTARAAVWAPPEASIASAGSGPAPGQQLISPCTGRSHMASGGAVSPPQVALGPFGSSSSDSWPGPTVSRERKAGSPDIRCNGSSTANKATARRPATRPGMNAPGIPFQQSKISRKTEARRTENTSRRFVFLRARATPSARSLNATQQNVEPGDQATAASRD